MRFVIGSVFALSICAGGLDHRPLVESEILTHLPASDADLVAKLKSSEPRVPEQTAEVVRTQRLALLLSIRKLINESGDIADKEGITANALRLLGELHFRRDVKVPGRFLTFERSNLGGGGVNAVWHRLPGVKAMIDSGMKGVEVAVAQAAWSDDPKVYRCAAMVVRGVFRPRVAIAYLDDAIEQETYPEHAARLRLLKEEVARQQREPPEL
jgi:hypothetical protein